MQGQGSHIHSEAFASTVGNPLSRWFFLRRVIVGNEPMNRVDKNLVHGITEADAHRDRQESSSSVLLHLLQNRMRIPSSNDYKFRGSSHNAISGIDGLTKK